MLERVKFLSASSRLSQPDAPESARERGELLDRAPVGHIFRLELLLVGLMLPMGLL